MKIGYFIGRLDLSGGAERVVSLKANWLAKHGHQVSIIAFMGENNSFYELDSKVKTKSLNCMPIIGNSIKSYFCTASEAKRKLREVLFEERFDVFIMAFPYLEKFVSEVKDGSKKIFESHCAYEFWRVQTERSTSNPMLRWLKIAAQQYKDRLLYTRFDRFVTLTERDLVRRGSPPNGVVIPNPNTFHPTAILSSDHHRVISVGRYSPEKGYQYLLQAWSIIEQKHPDWQLDLFGADRGEKDNLLALKDRLELKNTHLHEPTKQIQAEYLHSSIFAMSSINEGFPMVLTEAMVCGVPCVAFDCETGPREIITNMEDGIIIPKVGDVEGLATAICLLIDNDELRHSMGKKAVENVQRFTIDEIMNQWLKVFEL